MKSLLLYLLYIPLLWSKSPICIVPIGLNTEWRGIFNKPISYTNMQIDFKITESTKERMQALILDDKIKFALVRQDLLWQYEQNKDEEFHHQYIVLSTLPYQTQLFLIQNKNAYDMDLEELENKRVSIGFLGEGNNYYLKNLLREDDLGEKVLYRSYGYEKSIRALMQKTIDAYFAFLPEKIISEKYHYQTLFSEKVFESFEDKDIFTMRIDGIYSPYILIAALDTNDEEIENMIYRLMEKDIFIPQTDEKFGLVNRYVLNHVEAVQQALKKIYTQQQKSATKNNQRISIACHQYHYGFLKLLRQKPVLKKKLKHLYDAQRSRAFIKELDKVLFDVDKDKDKCDLHALKKKKYKFNKIKEKINYTINSLIGKEK